MKVPFPLGTASFICPGQPPLIVVQAPPLLIVRFSRIQRVASWAILGGGLGRTSVVAWLQVSEADLRPPVDAKKFVRSRLEAAGMPDAVGLLTSRDLSAHVDVSHRYRDSTCRCIATVGLGNALRAGDSPGPEGRIGTINVLCHASVPLSEEAMLEALALAAEARTLAVHEAKIPSQISRKPASGTGTDCIVIAAPEMAEPVRYVGKHTVMGHLIGRAVYDAVGRGVEQWKRDRASTSNRAEGAR